MKAAVVTMGRITVTRTVDKEEQTQSLQLFTGEVIRTEQTGTS